MDMTINSNLGNKYNTMNNIYKTQNTLVVFLTFMLFSGILLTTGNTFAREQVQIEKIVAVVNNDIILSSEVVVFMNQVKKRLRARKTALPSESVLHKQVLERLILLKLQLQLAKRTGIKIGDETVNRAIGNLSKRNKMSLTQFRLRLQRSGMTFTTFREKIRNELTLARLHRRAVLRRVQVSKQEVDDFLATRKHLPNKNSRYKIAHILVAIPDAASPKKIQKAQAKANKAVELIRSGKSFASVAVSHSDGQKALNGGMLGWFRVSQIPRYFLKTALRLKQGDISSPIRSPSGFHVIKIVEVSGKTKHIVRQYKASHILIRITPLISDAEAKRRLLRIRTRLQYGENFSDIAKAHSDDFSSKDGGDLGWLNPGATVAQFEKVMKKTKIGSISQPFKTQFGWHIVQVTDRRMQDNTDSFKRGIVLKLIRSRKQRERLQLWLRRLRDESYVEYRNRNQSS